MSATILHSQAKVKSKWAQLSLGFEKLGVPITYSQELENYRMSNFANLRGLILLEVAIDGKRKKVWFDIADHKRMFPQVILNGELYFKVQCHRDHLSNKNVRPIGQSVFRPDLYFEMVDKLRKLKDEKSYLYDVMGVFREHPKLDRRQCVDIVLQQKWKAFVRLFAFPGRQSIPVNEGRTQLSYENHLESQARAKISLSIPGRGHKCFRDTEVLGMGGCLLVLESGYVSQEKLDKKCWLTVKPDFSNFVEVVDYYLKHNDEREEVARNGRAYFDKYLSPEAMANNFLKEVELGIK